MQAEPKMTIDERLEKLTERHEALTQTVELIAADNRQTAQRMGKLVDSIDRLAGVVETLANTVRSHEHRPQRPRNIVALANGNRRAPHHDPILAAATPSPYQCHESATPPLLIPTSGVSRVRITGLPGRRLS